MTPKDTAILNYLSEARKEYPNRIKLNNLSKELLSILRKENDMTALIAQTQNQVEFTRQILNN